MKDGRIQQVGTPLEVYDAPANVFVAQFIGTPPMNFVDAVMSDARLNARGFSLPTRRPLTNGQSVRVGIRPENIVFAGRQARGETAPIQAIIEMVEPIGHEAIVHCRVGPDILVTSLDAHQMPRVGDAIDFVVELEALHLFDATTEERI
jgi:multiple sugar transport system ATP-binding protein